MAENQFELQYHPELVQLGGGDYTMVPTTFELVDGGITNLKRLEVGLWKDEHGEIRPAWMYPSKTHKFEFQPKFLKYAGSDCGRHMLSKFDIDFYPIFRNDERFHGRLDDYLPAAATREGCDKIWSSQLVAMYFYLVARKQLNKALAPPQDYFHDDRSQVEEASIAALDEEASSINEGDEVSDVPIEASADFDIDFDFNGSELEAFLGEYDEESRAQRAACTDDSMNGANEVKIGIPFSLDHEPGYDKRNGPVEMKDANESERNRRRSSTIDAIGPPTPSSTDCKMEDFTSYDIDFGDVDMDLLEDLERAERLETALTQSQDCAANNA